MPLLVVKAFDDVTPAFCALGATQDSVYDSMKSLERFVVLLYDYTSSQDSVKQTHKQLFTQKGRGIDGTPPHTHTQAAHELPSPGDWD